MTGLALRARMDAVGMQRVSKPFPGVSSKPAGHAASYMPALAMCMMDDNKHKDVTNQDMKLCI
jgi:hypothetical protein